MLAHLLLLAFLLPAQTTAISAALQKLNGDWSVDLRPSSTAPAHPMPMHLDIGAGGVITGMFYNGPIPKGLASDVKGRQCFAFTTADLSGEYHTSGCLTPSDTIEGQTWSEGRKFLLPWVATRAIAAQAPGTHP